MFTADKDNQKGEENILDPNGQIVSSKRFDGVYANNYFFYNYDIRGSVTNIIDPTGKLIKGYDYDEFGNTKDSDSTKNNNFKNEVKFTGAIEDQSAGLYYMNSRFYNPASGRFISQDTYSGSADEPWTQHLYNYTSNNPVNMVDPTGHAPTHPVIVADGGGEEPRPDPGEPQPWYVNLGITAAGIVVVGAGYALLSTGVYEVGAAVPTVASTGATVISYLGDKYSDVLYKGYNITSAAASKALSQLQEIMNWGEEEGTNAPDIVEKRRVKLCITYYNNLLKKVIRLLLGKCRTLTQ